MSEEKTASQIRKVLEFYANKAHYLQGGMNWVEADKGAQARAALTQLVELAQKRGKDMEKKNNRFMAILRKSGRSRDLFGNECAGKVIGPFTELRRTTLGAESQDRYFCFTDWDIQNCR